VFQNITSGSIALSPQTTSNPLIRQVFSNKVVRATNSSEFEPKFVYDLPPEFPFNDVEIQKSFSGSYGTSQPSAPRY
jgi:hypothetical protein